MNNKLSTIFLLIIFIALLVFCSVILQKENTNTVISTENEEVKNIENIKNNEEDNMEVLHVSNESFESEVLKSDKPVLVDFYADWCGPCKMVAPIVEQIANEHEDVKVVKVNLDENQDLAVEYGVTAIPTLIVIKNGEEKTRTVGVASKSEIESMIF